MFSCIIYYNTIIYIIKRKVPFLFFFFFFKKKNLNLLLALLLLHELFSHEYKLFVIETDPEGIVIPLKLSINFPVFAIRYKLSLA